MRTIFNNNNYYVLGNDNARISDALTSRFEADEFIRWLSETEEQGDAATLTEMFKREKAKRKTNKVSRKTKEDGSSATEESSGAGATTKSIPTALSTKASLQTEGGATQVSKTIIGGISNA